MKPSDALNRAAEIVIERGLAKGQLVDADRRVCMYGALQRACFLESEGRVIHGAAHRYLVSILGSGVPSWNDRPETTEAMVLGAFHEAALLAKADGQ